MFGNYSSSLWLQTKILYLIILIYGFVLLVKDINLISGQRLFLLILPTLFSLWYKKSVVEYNKTYKNKARCENKLAAIIKNTINKIKSYQMVKLA